MGKKKNAKAKTTKDYGYVLSVIGNVLLWVSLLTYFIVLPLYFKNGYELIATNKYKCFMFISKYSAIILGAFAILYFATWGMNGEEIKAFRPLKKMDIAMLAFLAVALLSHLVSNFKHVGEKGDYFFYESSLYGASGWFMGFMTFFILILMYFMISRFFKYTDKIWIPIILVNIVIFAWGIVNRYKIYPIDMSVGEDWARSAPSYVSSIGNINWFAGYQSVIAPLFIGFYWAEKTPWKRRLLAAAMFIADMALLLNGSDSAVMSFCVMAFVLLLVSLRSEEEMMSFSEVALMFVTSGICVFIVDKIFPGQRDMSSTLANIFVKGAFPFVLLVLCVALRFYFALCLTKKAKYPDYLKKNLSRIILIVTGSLFGVFVLLIIINTLSGSTLPLIGGSSLFTFDSEWGSDRGATWTCGIMTYAGIGFGNKLIGVGPDCFYFALSQNEAVYNYAYEIFGGARLTNAHNELISLLVNVGILGVGAFVTMCVFSIKAFLERTKKNPYMIAFALSMVMYLANNMFSFEQITNVPFFFLTIGIGAAAIVKEDMANKA